MDSRSNEDIIAEIQVGNNVTDNMELLYRKNLPLIKMLCKKYQIGLDWDDVEQEAYIALCDAVRLYNPEKGKFSNYLGYWIRHRLIRFKYADQQIHIPVHICNMIFQYERFVHDYEKEHGTLPQVEEITSATGFSITDIQNIKRAQSINVISLDAPQSGEDDDMSLSDIIADDRVNVEKEATDMVVHDMLNKEIKENLTPNQQKAVILVFCHGMKYKQVAAALGISTTRVGQMIKRSLEKLREGIARQYFTELEESESLLFRSGQERWENTTNSVQEDIAIRHEIALEELIAKFRKMYGEQREM